MDRLQFLFIVPRRITTCLSGYRSNIKILAVFYVTFMTFFLNHGYVSCSMGTNQCVTAVQIFPEFTRKYGILFLEYFFIFYFSI